MLPCCRQEPQSVSNPIRADGKPNIIFLTVDTLRADRIGMYGHSRNTMPVMEDLAKTSVVFETALVPRGTTRPSYASMLTGLYPFHHGVRTNTTVFHEDLTSLPEVLKAAGYATASFVSNFVLIAELSGMTQGFDVYDDRIEEREGKRHNYERRAENTVKAILEWLDTNPPEPFFLFTNFIDPHGPYNPPGRFKTKYRSNETRAMRRGTVPGYIYVDGEDNWYDYLDRYDGEASYVDQAFDILVKELKKRGMWAESLVVFTADHGESFGEHGRYFQHEEGVWDETLQVPLLIRLPKASRDKYGITPRRADYLASPMDLMPTVLAYLDLSADVEYDGQDLLDVIAGQVDDDPSASIDRTLLLEYSNVSMSYQYPRMPDVWALRTKRHKVIHVYDFETGELKRSAVYNLLEDPGETQPIRPSDEDPFHRELVDELDAMIAHVRDYKPPFPLTVYTMKGASKRQEFIAQRKQAGRTIHKTLTTDQVNRLRGLGYLE